MTQEPDSLTSSNEFDRVIAEAAPHTTARSEELDQELATLVRAARRVARPPRIGKFPRSAVVVVAAGALLIGAGTAAAATINDWAPWAQEPDGSYTYTLPGGAVCEARVGNIKGQAGEYEPVAAAIQDYLSKVDIMAVADVDAALADIRSSEIVMMPGGEPGGFGTEYYDADTEYQNAVHQAVDLAIQEELARRGLTEASQGVALSYEGETHCSGGQ